MKAYFLQRVLAYFIDSIVVFFLVLPFSFFIPIGNYNELNEELVILEEQYIQGKEDIDQFITIGSDLSYEISKCSAPLTIVEIAIYILYFVVYQRYNNGQTIGKKCMKIRIKKVDDSSLSYDDLIKRVFINQFLIFSILLLITLPFMDGITYMMFSASLSFVIVILFLVMLFMVMFRKDGRGIHDFFAKTEVVLVDDRIKEIQTVN